MEKVRIIIDNVRWIIEVVGVVSRVEGVVI